MATVSYSHTPSYMNEVQGIASQFAHSNLQREINLKSIVLLQTMQLPFKFHLPESEYVVSSSVDSTHR